MEADNYLDGPDAFAFARLRPKDFDNAVQRDLIPWLPPRVRKHRRFSVNDLIAAHILGTLLERAVMAKAAAAIATDVLALVRASPELEVLSAWKCFNADHKPYVRVAEHQPQPGSIELFRFQVGEIRRRAIAGIAQRREGQI
jgi:hypothetical protein